MEHPLLLDPRRAQCADQGGRHCWVGSLAGAAHLLKDNVGILRWAQRGTLAWLAGGHKAGLCPPGTWLKCERFYALWTLRCIPGRRTEAPQVIETWWFWLGRLGSLCFSMKIINWNVRGLGSRNKRRMVKDFLRSANPDVVMIQETKKEKCDRRFVGSVWTVRNKDWVALPASGASGGILIIWDSKNLRSEEVVIGSFSVSVKFALDGCGPL